MKFILLLLLVVNANDVCTCRRENNAELGRNTWFLLHEMAKHPKSAANVFEDFMYHLAYLYPCKECSKHMMEYFEEHVPVMSEQWVHEFHNDVNRRLGKPKYNLL